MYFRFRVFFEPFVLFIHLAFSLCFLVTILVQNRWVSFASCCWYVFVFPPSFWKNFLSLFWNILFCLYCLNLCRYLFNLSSFIRTIQFISWSYIIFSCIAFSFLYLHFPASFICSIILAYFRRYFICVSNRIYGFDFFLRAFWGDPNFLTN